MSDIDRRVLQTIIETANDHFFIVSGDGQIMDISPGAEAVYGVSREELLSEVTQVSADKEAVLHEEPLSEVPRARANAVPEIPNERTDVEASARGGGPT